jgi:hypothetical protein
MDGDDDDIASMTEAEQLMVEAQQHSPFLQRLNAGDISSLTSVINVVRVRKGEQVLCKGEPATWVGIVLSGSLAAEADGKVIGTMDAGHIVGELAFFAGGVRMANVQGAQVSCEHAVRARRCARFDDAHASHLLCRRTALSPSSPRATSKSSS